MGSRSDERRLIRPGLFAAAGCWAGLAVANYAVSDALRWYPDVVAVFATLTAICVFLLAINPAFVFVYRVGGSLAIGTLLLRLASIIEGVALAGLTRDLIWLSLANISMTLVLIGTYWRWWLGDVKIWHETRKRAGLKR